MNASDSSVCVWGEKWRQDGRTEAREDRHADWRTVFLNPSAPKEGASLTRCRHDAVTMPSRCGQPPWSEPLPTARPCAEHVHVWTAFHHWRSVRSICCRRCGVVAERAAWAAGMKGARHGRVEGWLSNTLPWRCIIHLTERGAFMCFFFFLAKAGYVLYSMSIDPCLVGEDEWLSSSPFSLFFSSYLIHLLTASYCVIFLAQHIFLFFFFSFSLSNNEVEAWNSAIWVTEALMVCTGWRSLVK